MRMAAAECLVARLEAEPDGRIRLLSPVIGQWIDPPPTGALVGPGSSLGRIERLSRRFELIAPEGALGRVLDGLPSRRIVAVGYGDVLLTLAPLEAGPAGSPGMGHEPVGDRTAAPDLRAVVAPSDGVFYGAPSPGADPYVRVGNRVRLGQPVGLVEVMKTFHQLTYGGPGFPDEAEVVEIRGRDGAEVRAGETLFLFR